MIQIRPSRPEEVPLQKELWKRCFGDSDAYVDMFYQKYCVPQQVLIVEEDGELNSMATMLETTMHFPDGSAHPVGYVYGLATNPYIQGKGYARQLLAYADQYLKEKGMKCLTLVPASPSLHRYFENIGLSECFATRKVEKMAGELPESIDLGADCKIVPILPSEYNLIREQQLKGTMHIAYDDKLIHFQQFGSHLTAGDLYRVEVEGEVGCVAIEYVQRSRLLMKELIISPPKMEKAVQLVSQELPAARYHIRTPAFWDGMKGSYIQAFGMIKWYDKDLQHQWFAHQDAYLGLAFD